MTDTTPLAQMSPEELLNLWQRDPELSIGVWLHALIQRATREANEYRKWWKESEAKRHCRCWADRAPDEPCICPAPVEAAPSVMGYTLEVNAPDAPDKVTVKHNGKPVFTVALATGGGR